MGNDALNLAMIVSVSTLVNTVHAIQTQGAKNPKQRGNPVTTALAGALTFVALATFGGLTGRYDLAKAVAVLFLVGALVMHGIPLVTGTNALVSSTQK